MKQRKTRGRATSHAFAPPLSLNIRYAVAPVDQSAQEPDIPIGEFVSRI
jgi:hypothetical protein